MWYYKPFKLWEGIFFYAYKIKSLLYLYKTVLNQLCKVKELRVMHKILF